jgi:tripartite ATP-independent transporter DctM subunit
MLAIFLGVFVFFMIVGVPVVFAMGGTALVTSVILWGFAGVPLNILVQQTVAGLNNFAQLAIPVFLFAGQLMNTGGITDRIFRFCQSLVGHWPGGLGHVNVMASVIFSGMSGTAAADAGGLGMMEIKAMRDQGFDMEFSAAITGASSLIGPIIPPSVPMVMYGCLAGVSVTSLFIGGLLPGLLMALGMSIMVAVYAIKRNYPRSEKQSMRVRWKSFVQAFPSLMTPVIIIGGIWSGIFTPTEAAAVAVLYAFILIIFVYRELSFKQFVQAAKNCVIDSAAVLGIIAFVKVYGYVLTRTQLPMKLAAAVFTITTNPVLIVLLLIGFLLIIGCFMSTMESITLFTPIFLPMLTACGVDLIVFGVIMVLTLMIGQLTPPFGIVLFVITKISGLEMMDLVKAALPFAIPVLIVTIMIVFVPQIVTFLPGLIG